MSKEAQSPEFGWYQQYGLLWVALAPVVAQIIGSTFNIWYNVTHVKPLLTAEQYRRLVSTIVMFNAAVYPAAVAGWLFVVFRLRGPFRGLLNGQVVDADSLWRARRRAINLPWWMAGIGGAAWLSCIPVLVVSLLRTVDPLDSQVAPHLAVSIVVAGLIAVTHGFFAIELASHRCLFPVIFGETQPSSTRGAYPLTLGRRGIVWAISAGVCPILSLLLLLFVPEPDEGRNLLFPTAVGLLAILFGLTTAWMLGRFYAEPVRQLKRAAQRVSEGQLDTRVDLLRPDEFGPLIAEFNEMVAGLRDKKRLREMFGLHVGADAAAQILARDPGLGGVERQVTIVFVDIRNFTANCCGRAPQQVVTILNEFLTEMVDVVQQQCNGMVNKYLGDGFMALFGAGEECPDHADAALRAGQGMLIRLSVLNERLRERGITPLAIGIGIHTGNVLIGSIGSQHRLEFTAIGDAVNIASRVESLTKAVGVPLLLTAATSSALTGNWSLVQCAPQVVKGVSEPLVAFTLKMSP